MNFLVGGQPERFAPFAQLYREAGRRAGHDPSRLTLSINSHGFLADDSKQAADDYFPSFALMMNKIGRERGWSGITQSIVIDLGKANGIEPGMPVVTERGLVGRITDVYNNSSRVLLINDSNSSVNTLLQNSRLRGILRGRAGQQPIMDYLPQDNKVLVGDIVVTSGESGNFPAGVPVGQVVEVEQNDVEMFQRAVVRTTVDFDTLETVLVVTNFKPLQDAIDLPDK